MKTQQQYYYESVRKESERDQLFLELIQDKENPMTQSDLLQLIEKRPNVYGKYKEFLNQLTK